MLTSLGESRSSRKPDHLLQTPDTFIRTPLPAADGVEFIVHAAPQLGAAFSWMTAEFKEGGTLPPALPGLQRFVYVLEGELEFEVAGEGLSATLTPGQYAFDPDGMARQFRASVQSRVVVIEKRYEGITGSLQDAPGRAFVGDESSLPSESLGGDSALQVKRLMPDGPAWDFAVNTMTYDPGASLAMVEVHVMEHGLLMLEGGGIYRLGDNWYPVSAGDFIWMAPYCPQWFGALGKIPAKYLIYKDWYRHPLGA